MPEAAEEDLFLLEVPEAMCSVLLYMLEAVKTAVILMTLLSLSCFHCPENPRMKEKGEVRDPWVHVSPEKTGKTLQKRQQRSQDVRFFAQTLRKGLFDLF